MDLLILEWYVLLFCVSIITFTFNIFSNKKVKLYGTLEGSKEENSQ